MNPYNIPDHVVVATVEKIARRLVRRYIFGSYTIADLNQECQLIAHVALNRTKGIRYDSSRELEAFLHTEIQNKLKNLLRDKNFRNESPCKGCPAFNSETLCTRFDNRFDCNPYKTWRVRNEQKSSLAAGGGANPSNEPSTENNFINEMARQEMIELIDASLPGELRPYFLKMLGGLKVPTKKIQEVRETIRTILQESGRFPELDDYFESEGPNENEL